MDKNQVLAMRKIQYRHILQNIEKYLQNCKIVPETEIFLYLDYPEGWHATVGANNRVYVVTSTNGVLKLTIEPAVGFAKNGTLRRYKVFRKDKLLKGEVDGH